MQRIRGCASPRETMCQCITEEKVAHFGNTKRLVCIEVLCALQIVKVEFGSNRCSDVNDTTRWTGLERIQKQSGQQKMTQVIRSKHGFQAIRCKATARLIDCRIIHYYIKALLLRAKLVCRFPDRALQSKIHQQQFPFGVARG